MALTKVQTGSIQDSAVTEDKIDGTYTSSVKTNPEFQGTEAARMPVGTTAQRDNAQSGDIRFNSTTSLMEYYDGTNWKAIDAPPTISSIDVTEVDSQAGGNQTIVITGSGFSSGATVTFVGNSATDFNASTVTVNSETQITAVAPKSSFLNAQEPYGVKVINISGLSATLASQINVDSSPSWNTASGNIGTVYEDVALSSALTPNATDPDGDTIVYSVNSGSLPTGLSLNSANGEITGTPNVNDTYASAGVTHTFDLRATANSKTSDRTFNIIRKWYDGSTSALAVTNAQTLVDNLSFTSSDDGLYYIKPTGRSAIQVYCEFNSFGGWMLFCQGDGSSSPIPSTTGASGNITTLLGGTKGKHDDADFNAIAWNYNWHGMTDNNTDNVGSANGNNTMDRQRQNFTTSGTKFTINWTSSGNSALTSGNTDNGRNQTWSYKGIGGSSGSSLTGSSRQPNSAVINTDGSTDDFVGDTNSYYIGTHDAGTGGSWIHSADGSGGNMNSGFGSDYNNVAWTSRHSYWFFK